MNEYDLNRLGGTSVSSSQQRLYGSFGESGKFGQTPPKMQTINTGSKRDVVPYMAMKDSTGKPEFQKPPKSNTSLQHPISSNSFFGDSKVSGQKGQTQVLSPERLIKNFENQIDNDEIARFSLEDINRELDNNSKQRILFFVGKKNAPPRQPSWPSGDEGRSEMLLSLTIFFRCPQASSIF